MPRRKKSVVTPLVPPVSFLPYVERGRPGRPPSVDPVDLRSSASSSESSTSDNIFAMDGFSPAPSSPPQPMYIPRTNSLAYVRHPEPISPTYYQHHPNTGHTSHRRHQAADPQSLAGPSFSVRSPDIPAPRRRVRSDATRPPQTANGHRRAPTPQPVIAPPPSSVHSPYYPPPHISHSYAQSPPMNTPRHQSSRRYSHSSQASPSSSSGPYLAPSPRSSGNYGSHSPHWLPNASLPSPPIVTNGLSLYDIQSGSGSSTPSQAAGSMTVGHSLPVRVPMQRSSSRAHAQPTRSHAGHRHGHRQLS